MKKFFSAALVTAPLLLASAPRVSIAEPVVSGWLFVSAQRVSRTEYEYEFRAQLTNPDSTALAAAAAIVTSSFAPTVIVNDGTVDDRLEFGAVAPGQTVTSTDTFKLRHDSRYRLNSSFIHFAVEGVAQRPPGTASPAARHVLERITFGTTPELLARIRDTAAAYEYFQQQLSPQDIDDSALEGMLGSADPASETDLARWQLARAIHSKRQLLEVMTAFWDNHFNTDLASHDVVAWELAENRALRTHALGNFRNLLDASAKSPAMLHYLDGVDSVARDPADPNSRGPNQNYPRELKELHTMGVDGGYTQLDVEESARAFTGWTVRDGAFHFDPTVHDTGQKVVLGVVIPSGGGISDGETVLDVLATHPSTAHFICSKLVVLLVSDDPPASMVQSCAGIFAASAQEEDQIARAITSIVRHRDFVDPAYRRVKVKTPLEHAASIARNFGVSTRAEDLPPRMVVMGMPLFRNPVPTGYGETAVDWVNPSFLLERVNFADWASFNSPGAGRTSVDPWVHVHANGLRTAPEIVDYFLELAVGIDFTSVEREMALEVLGAEFDVDSREADYRLRTLLATILSYPSYQLQ